MSLEIYVSLGQSLSNDCCLWSGQWKVWPTLSECPGGQNQCWVLRTILSALDSSSLTTILPSTSLLVPPGPSYKCLQINHSTSIFYVSGFVSGRLHLPAKVSITMSLPDAQKYLARTGQSRRGILTWPSHLCPQREARRLSQGNLWSEENGSLRTNHCNLEADEANTVLWVEFSLYFL